MGRDSLLQITRSQKLEREELQLQFYQVYNQVPQQFSDNSENCGFTMSNTILFPKFSVAPEGINGFARHNPLFN